MKPYCEAGILPLPLSAYLVLGKSEIVAICHVVLLVMKTPL